MAEPQERPRSGWRHLRPRSIRARVTVWAVAVLAVVVGVLAMVAFNLVRENMLQQGGERAGMAALSVAEEIMERRYEGYIPVSEPIVRLQVVEQRTHEVLATSAALEGQPALTPLEPEEDDPRMETTVCGETAGAPPDDCFRVVGYSVPNSAYGDVVVFAATALPGFLDREVLVLALTGMALILLTGMGMIIWYGVGRALRPVGSISDEMERISVTDLHRRVPVPKGDDEITHLARTANASLARLEESVARQRRFVSDASHELRNPISGMLVKLEMELSDPDPDPGGRERLLNGLLADTERLQNIVSDLLELARMESDVSRDGERVELTGLVREEFGGRRLRHELNIHDAEPVEVVVDRLRLTRLLTNLVANAERHAQSRIDIVIGHDHGFAVIEVHDDGAGIPVKDRERVFERFARLPESRKRDPEGSGLGLAISREVAHAYGGTLVAGQSDLLGGAVFTLCLPVRTPTAG
ncbi:sensor histidine kinase [Nocardiopsis alkaliphila]|uniref:sensor histidine kinase n=1 Tax=Nocardiopsis alkaliphila TaxID=225762 RepID=UPI00034D3926|nr:HAMP domain-containing sensor histidine kinase [Nocardiopsis alkaliphila]